MDDCIFCRIVAGEAPAHYVYEDDFVVAFLSLEQPNPYKVLVIPRAHKDAFNDYYHVFLVPDEGYGRIIRLHDQMYADKLFPERALEIDFIPHIGIGNSRDPLACLALTREWNKQDFAISGRVLALDIVSYKNDTTKTIQKIQLKDT